MNKKNIIYASGIFTYYHYDEASLPHQGWKIHLSTIPAQMEKVKSIVSKYCQKNKISYKHMSTKKIVQDTMSKSSDAQLTGKVFTLYPVDELVFIKTVKELYLLLADFQGPYIITDKRYKDSIIYYRYGVIRPTTLDKNFIYNKDGEKHLDRSVPYYRCPDFVKDPFEKQQEQTKTISFLLSNRYSIIKSLHASNFGGIFLAKDTYTNTEVVIKEARPYLGYDELNTAINLRKNEKRLIHSLEYLNAFPKYIDSFYSDECFFLVVEKVKGVTLEEFMNTHSPLLHSRNNTNNLPTIYKNIEIIFKNLRSLVNTVHEKDYILHDISAQNFIVLENFSVKFIDLEMVCHKDSKRMWQLELPCKDENAFYSDKVNLLILLIEIIQPAIYEYYKHVPDVNQSIILLKSFFMSIDAPVSLVNFFEEFSKELFIGTECNNNEVKNSLITLTWDCQSLEKFILSHQETKLISEKKSNKNVINGKLGEAYFLIEVSKNAYDTKKEKNLLLAKKLIKQATSSKKINNGFYTLPMTSEKDTKFSPHLATGTGGLIKTIINFLNEQYDEELEKELYHIFEFYDVTYTRYVEYFHGMTGILDCYLDMYKYSKKREYLQFAKDFYLRIAPYKIQSDEFLIFPCANQKASKEALIENNVFILSVLKKLLNHVEEEISNEETFVTV